EKRQRNRLSDAVMEILADEAEPVDSDSQVQLVTALKHCLTKLPPRSRSMIEMLYEDEKKPAQIAEEINWEVNGVYVALSRARSQLKACVNAKLKQAPAE
ncbi:MAG: sigma factor-like helix-turn-helix DNA-binding protein, partial [Verrucomicrobiota bacterium]